MTITEAVWHPWRPAAWLEARGSDAFGFLQGQFTNDLHQLERTPAVYGLWLDRKGRCVADSFVLRRDGGDGFVIGSYFSSAASIRGKLEGNIIADDVTIADRTDEVFGVTFAGPGASERAARSGAGVVFPGRRGLPGSVEWVGATPPQLGEGTRLGDSEMGAARIASGIPAVPLDIGPGDLPNEGGLDAEAISYTKGCYLGQEVIARLKSMGQVRRRLMRVRGGGSPPASSARLFQGAQVVGELRSVASVGGEFVGLAMLVLHHWKRAEGLALIAGGPARMHIEGPRD